MESNRERAQIDGAAAFRARRRAQGLWAELGEQGAGRIVTLINDLATLITIEAARTAPAEVLGDRRILLGIDVRRSGCGT